MTTSMDITLSAASVMAKGRLFGTDLPLYEIATDTRKLPSGALYIALRGDHFDGHAFLQEAATKGAAGAMVEQKMAHLDLPQIVVDDTQKALGRLAAAWRRKLSPCLIGITGSNGKTSVKEMLVHILGQANGVLGTQGNLNNHIGLPLTLLRLRSQDRYAVVEMGANHPGEIAYLSELAHPTVALLTNAGPAHLKGFGTLDGVAAAKGEIFSGLTYNGTAVIYGDDPFCSLWCQLARKQSILRFGSSKAVEIGVYQDSIRLTQDPKGLESHFQIWSPQGEMEMSLRLPGRHNIINALAAIATALAVGMELPAIRQGLALVPTVPGRLQPRSGLAGSHLLDDSYNANPGSVKAALDLLREWPGERWLVLGDMAELGPQTEALHQQVGEWARKAGISRLFTLGVLSRKAGEVFGANAQFFNDFETLRDTLQAELGAGIQVLIKGSRAARMERVVQALADKTGEK